MVMSAISRPSKGACGHSPPGQASKIRWRVNDAGYTLIEMLVVLTIAGLLISLVLPRFWHTIGRAELAAQRKSLLGQINQLGYRAFVGGTPVVLDSTPLPDGRSPIPVVVVPSGWRLDVPKPIEYTFTGVCAGGRLTLISPEQVREEFELAPPLCQIGRNGL